MASDLVGEPALLRTRLPVFGAYLVLFAAVSGLLLYGGRGNRAASLLGGLYLLLAAPWADAPLSGLVAARWPLLELQALKLLRPDAFHAYFLWTFAGAFPSQDLYGRARRSQIAGRSLALALGVFLASVNLAPLLWPGGSSSEPLPWARVAESGFYWSSLFTLDIAALIFLVVRAHRARPIERRRVGLFVAALAAGAAPMLLVTVAEPFFPAIADLWQSPRSSRVLLLIIDIGLLSIPLTTTYAVLVDRIVDVRFVLRKAMQYSMARFTLVALTAAPFTMLVVLVYRARQESLATLLSGRGLLLSSLVLFGGVAVKARACLLRSLDRRFFREEWDASRILMRLAEELRDCDTAQGLGKSLHSAVGRSLHPVSFDLLLLSEDSEEFISTGEPAVRLGAGGPLPTWIGTSAIPVDCETLLRESEGALEGVEVDWLVDGDYALLVPVLGAGKALIALIALGPKQSELPYSKEDRTLLSSLAASIVLVIETRLPTWAEGPISRLSGQETAVVIDRAVPSRARRSVARIPGARTTMVCSKCGIVASARGSPCSFCGGVLEQWPLPRLIREKFLLERLVGRGGMGVVFKARDLDLDRAVAIKTLPHISARYAGALRREARAMAAVTHPNLALIFGAESHHRLPLLIFEYLENGTLADRIRQGQPGVRQVIAWGRQLSGVTDCIHKAGILHRDIKPSNIGFSADGTPKLLDFGLARLVRAARLQPGSPAHREAGGQEWSQPRRVAGTVLYLSPEAVRGRRPDFTFDLWSLAVSLYEALAGVHPFLGRSTRETLARIDSTEVPPLTGYRPECPAELSHLFERALARDPGRRFPSARRLEAEFQALETRLAA